MAGTRWRRAGVVGGVGAVVGGALLARPLLAERVLPAVRARMLPRRDGAGRRAAVVLNPAKPSDADAFRTQVADALRARGWAEPLFLETTEEDPGRTMVEKALAEHVDLVLAAGGDGTVNVVCQGLADTGVPLGLLPVGTTNLLARNLGIALDLPGALAIALDGRLGHVDLLRIVPDGRADEAAVTAVIASAGLDADAFASTDPQLKEAVGHAAYVVAGARRVVEGEEHTFLARVSVDDGEPLVWDATTVMVGNVAAIQGGLEVLPGARPDDGLLHVVIVAPGSARDVAHLVGDVATGRQHRTGIDQTHGERALVELDAARPWQVDGDVRGEATQLDVTVMPGALAVMVPELPPRVRPTASMRPWARRRRTSPAQARTTTR